MMWTRCHLRSTFHQLSCSSHRVLQARLPVFSFLANNFNASSTHGRSENTQIGVQREIQFDRLSGVALRHTLDITLTVLQFSRQWRYFPFSALTLLVGRQEGHLPVKSWVLVCWW